MAKESKVTFLRFVKALLSCLALAIFLTALNHYSIYFPWELEGEEVMVGSTSLKKEFRSDYKDKSGSFNKDRIVKDFLVIDISQDSELYCDSTRADALGLAYDDKKNPEWPCYTTPNIGKLVRLFKWLSENTDRYHIVVCDLIFDGLDSSKQTNDLLGYIKDMVQDNAGSKIIFSGIYDKHNEQFTQSYATSKLPKEYMGAVNVQLTHDKFLKYQLTFNDGKVKTLPLLMLERIDTFKISPGRFLVDTYKKGDITITANNVFVPELIYLSEDFDSLSTLGNFNNGTVDASTGRMELWQTLLKFDDKNNYYLEEVLKGSTQKKRNIFIGSFNHSHEDVHKTAYGDIDGGLIMLNIYYNLLMNENSVHKGYIAFIILGFMLISYLMLYHPKPPFHFKSAVLNTITEIIVDELHYIILVIMTFLSSYWFDKAANLVAMVIVVFVLSKIIQIIQAKKGKRPVAAHD